MLTAGANDWGQCGTARIKDEGIPRVVQALQSRVIVAIAAGEHHSAAVTADGLLYTWGRGSEGQLGHGLHSERAIAAGGDSFASVPVPRFVASLDGARVVAVACGARFTVLVVASGAVRSFSTAAGLGAEQ